MSLTWLVSKTWEDLDYTAEFIQRVTSADELNFAVYFSRREPGKLVTYWNTLVGPPIALFWTAQSVECTPIYVITWETGIIPLDHPPPLSTIDKQVLHFTAAVTVGSKAFWRLPKIVYWFLWFRWTSDQGRALPSGRNPGLARRMRWSGQLDDLKP